MNVTINLTLSDEYAKELKEKFPQLKKLTNKFITTKLIRDYIGNMDIFEAKYYNDNDIKDIFKL